MTNTSLAIVFPGQGSQSVGMSADILAEHHDAMSVMVEASDVLGYDMWQLIKNGPKEKLDQTEFTQPALLAASYATWTILQKDSPQPAFLAGHSLGEYTALVCAGAISFADALKLVSARGRFMQSAVTKGEGAMAAIIGLPDDAVAKLCQEVVSSDTDVLSPANYNSKGQVVIAGHRERVLRAVTLAKEQGAKMAVEIPVSVPSHCALMQPAAEKLAVMLREVTINATTIPVVNNVDVEVYTTADDIRDGLVRQLYMPVRWVGIVEYLSQAGVSQLVECGPGKVLTGLNKRINKALTLFSTQDTASLNTLRHTSLQRST